MSSYDQNLLDEAPRATRAQLQEGYNVDLLEEEPPRRKPSTRAAQPPPPPAPDTIPLTPGTARTGSGEKFGSRPHTPLRPRPRTPFWRRRNGIVIIAVVVLVVIGAVVGGAVGGTAHKGNHNNAGTKVVPTSQGNGGSQGAAPATPTPTAGTGGSSGSNAR